MLALTTYAEPKNFPIDLAFLGLSTITNPGRSPLRSAGADCSEFFSAFFRVAPLRLSSRLAARLGGRRGRGFSSVGVGRLSLAFEPRYSLPILFSDCCFGRKRDARSGSGGGLIEVARLQFLLRYYMARRVKGSVIAPLAT